MLRTELKRAFINRNFLVALFLGIATLAIGLNDYAVGYEENLKNINAGADAVFIYSSFDALLWARSLLIFTSIAPLLALLPFSDSFTFDSTSQYIRLLIPRSTRARYIGSKFVANALVGGTVLTLASLAIYAMATVIFPETGPTVVGQPRIIVSGPLSEFYPQQPELYIWMQILISFVFGATYATIGMFVSLITENRFVVLTAPFIFYIGLTFVFGILGEPRWMPTATLDPRQATNSSWLTVFGQLGTFFSLSTIGIFLISRHKLKDL